MVSHSTQRNLGSLLRSDCGIFTEEHLSSRPPKWLQMVNGRAPYRRNVIAVDVETTGLGSSDRIVTFGAVLLNTKSLSDRPVRVHTTHLIFNPERRCHPQATAVHGWDDNILRRQDKFAAHCTRIISEIQKSNLIVSHNFPFDLRFINNELELCGKSLIHLPSCSLQWALRDHVSPAPLRSIA